MDEFKAVDIRDIREICGIGNNQSNYRRRET